MSAETNISWADHTHNHWLGCTKVSNGPLGACEGCYAKVLVEDRFGRAEFGGPGKGVGTRTLTSEANRRKPIQWDRAAAKNGTRPFVFCSSLADVFDNTVPPEWRADLFDLIRRTPNLVWLLLTKRPANIIKLFADTLQRTADKRDAALREAWPRNAAIGCTAVTQAEAGRDIPKLLAAKAALNPAFAFLSVEPLMEPVDLTSIDLDGYSEIDPLTGTTGCEDDDGEPAPDWPALDWVITGGETDQGSHKARPSHPDWFRAIRDQCAAAGVPFHHKQNGEWAPTDAAGIGQDRPITDRWGNVCDWMSRYVVAADGTWGNRVQGHSFTEHATNLVYRVGRRRAGRTLDGVIHDARPQCAGCAVLSGAEPTALSPETVDRQVGESAAGRLLDGRLHDAMPGVPA